VREKLQFIARHPWITAAGVAASAGLYQVARPHLPAAREKAVAMGMSVGMAAFRYCLQVAMSSFASGASHESQQPSQLADLQFYTRSQFLPLLQHVNLAVDGLVGNLKQSITALQAANKTLSPPALAARICAMAQQALASHIVKGYAFAHLYSLEQFVLHVSALLVVARWVTRVFAGAKCDNCVRWVVDSDGTVLACLHRVSLLLLLQAKETALML
jgi:hypothetical protein